MRSLPIIAEGADHDLWLDPGMTDVKTISEMLKPYDTLAMRCYPVSPRVNHAVNDDAVCSTPVAIRTQDSLF